MILNRISSEPGEHSSLQVSSNTRTESTINYANAPPVGSGLGSSGAFGAAVWININLTAYITGNGSHKLALMPLSTTAVSFTSRESSNIPQLIWRQHRRKT